jgi:hypothetical protein
MWVTPSGVSGTPAKADILGVWLTWWADGNGPYPSSNLAYWLTMYAGLGVIETTMLAGAIL